MENNDLNCRLRHGLNVHCLAWIFQYLDIMDLYTVGGMNDFYREIINDLVISKHEVRFCILLPKITIAQVFERLGTKFQKLNFNGFHLENIEELVPLISQYCSIDQLKKISGLSDKRLYEVGGMNDLYKRTINDLMIPSYWVHFRYMYKYTDITWSQ